MSLDTPSSSRSPSATAVPTDDIQRSMWATLGLTGCAVIVSGVPVLGIASFVNAKRDASRSISSALGAGTHARRANVPTNPAAVSWAGQRR
jgi:hypothetical protein